MAKVAKADRQQPPKPLFRGIVNRLLVAAVIIVVATGLGIYFEIIGWPVAAGMIKVGAYAGLWLMDWFIVQPLLILPRLVGVVFVAWFIGSWYTRGLKGTFLTIKHMGYDPGDGGEARPVPETVRDRIADAINRPIENIKRGIWRTVKKWALIIGGSWLFLQVIVWFL